MDRCLMPVCNAKRLKRRHICAGDLNDRIIIKSRNTVAPQTTVDFSQNFKNDRTVWAGVETTSGRNTFYVSNIDDSVTHVFYLRWFDGLTSENWIEFKNENYDILEVENWEERDEWAVCYCNVRGDKDEAVNHA